MRAGISITYWPWFTWEQQLRLAMLADEVGLDSVWTAEAWGQDAVSTLGYLAAKTERVALGTMLMQMPARKPTATAMAAATIDVISGGRLRLGLGLSGPQVSEGWYGVPFGKPLARTREYIEIVRRTLDGEKISMPLENGGEGATGLGKPLRLLAQPVQKRIPIYLGAIGPKAVEQTAEIADGWVPFMVNPQEPEQLLGPLAAGLSKAGRARSEIDVLAALPMAIDDDIATARALVKPWIAFYLGAMGAREKNFYVDLADGYGFGDSAREVQRRFLAGDRAGAADAVDDEFIDITTIATTPAGLDDRLAAYERTGVDGLMVVPCGDHEQLIRTLGAALK